jgi:hypothetical protein
MDFFSRFPQIVIQSNDKPIIITDFLRRVSLSDKFRINTVVLGDYLVKDGETPEMVSNTFYGKPEYHWIILMVNDITNPREEWPILDVKVTDLVYLKYDFKIEVPAGNVYNVNDIITSDNDGKFIVTKVVGNVIHMRSQVGKILLTTSNTLNNVTEEIENLTMITITDPEEDVHHYYDTELGYIVDENFSNNTIPVSNYTYEIEKNDEKRTIKILDSSYVESVANEFTDLINR